MGSSAGPLAPGEFWNRLRAGITDRYAGFRVETPLPTEERRRKAVLPSVVGAWGGRTWEASFREPKPFSPDVLVGITTAARLVEFARMPSEWIPWLYAGERPRVLSKNVFDFDRIIMRYRRREGNFTGTLTGDGELDRRWGIYPYEERLAEVFRDARVRDTLRSFARLSPNPKNAIPTIAVVGTEATLTLPIASLVDHVEGATEAIDRFAHILDRLEEVRGSPPASRRPIDMDLVRDEHGVPFPVPRFPCPICQESTHPRYQANLETEVCEKCGKALYRWS